ncbi:uncharacterized protein LOC113210207 isoform X2 [Frankliniella occidentalis]|uniref:Uncharacterized protein LOC113210207 isoform X2 n=1 Tax=Frankliniella occidentalis TaxID=133901 RepID=A0A9C6TW01_FRAOC|nr:uncharacterized protein LOC113210207 isoform X2 [Frankliniella occidentalis]
MGSGQTGAASGAAAAGAPATARGGGDEELDLLDAVGGGVVASAQQLARSLLEKELRVEVLEDPAGQALRRRHAQAGALVAQVAVELGSLEEQVRALAAAGAQLQEVAAGDDPDRQEQNLERRTAQLEARWAGLAGRLDMIASGRTAIPATTLGSGPPLTRPLFLDTEESFNTFHRLCLDIQEVCSLLKKN